MKQITPSACFLESTRNMVLPYSIFLFFFWEIQKQKEQNPQSDQALIPTVKKTKGGRFWHEEN